MGATPFKVWEVLSHKVLNDTKQVQEIMHFRAFLYHYSIILAFLI